MIYSWRGEKQLETIIENYDSVNVKFITGNTSLGKIPVVMQAKNTSIKKVAILIIKPIGSEKTVISTIDPGGTISKTIPAMNSGIDVQVKYIDNKEDAKIDVIKYLKDFVGNRLILKNGKFEKT